MSPLNLVYFEIFSSRALPISFLSRSAFNPIRFALKNGIALVAYSSKILRWYILTSCKVELSAIPSVYGTTSGLTNF